MEYINFAQKKNLHPRSLGENTNLSQATYNKFSTTMFGISIIQQKILVNPPKLLVDQLLSQKADYAMQKTGEANAFMLKYSMV